MPEHQTKPSALVIFGITGDLAQRKLLPAIYHLFKDGLMGEHTRIIGTSRRELNLDEFMNSVELCVLEDDNVCDPTVVAQLRSRLELVQFDPEDNNSYQALRTRLDALEREEDICMDRLYYLSVPPKVYRSLVQKLGEHSLNTSCPHGTAAARLLVEKPFGHDLTSAQELIDETARSFSEDQIFRIDHYLAKETAQNILTFRAHNPIFVDLWNNRHVQKIDIVAAEKIGIEGRANFYEGLGALRDLIQSHLLQLLALVTMDLPGDLNSSEDLHAARKLLLDATHALQGSAKRAQYEGYRTEVKNNESTTETYASIEVAIDNERWRGTPVTIITGKSLSEKKTEIVLQFSHEQGSQEPNTLTFRIQPNEGIGIALLVKKPGFASELQPAVMDFRYHEAFASDHQPDAYERVLVDAMRGDRTLFASSDEVLASWRIIQPILDKWQADQNDMLSYAQGSNGPTLAPRD